MTAHRCAGGLKTAFDLPLGSPTIDITCPSKHRHRDTLFMVYSEKPPHVIRLLRRAWGYGGPILVLNPGPHGGRGDEVDSLSQLKGEHPGKKQKNCSLTSFLSQIQHDTSGPEYSQMYLHVKLNRDALRTTTVCKIPYHMRRERCRLEEGRNLFRLECWLFAGKLFLQTLRK